MNQFAGGRDITKNLSLDKFLSKYTSEDNAAFEVILEKDIKNNQEKHAWLRMDDSRDTTLAIAGSETLALEDSRQGIPDHWQYKAKNSLMYGPEGQQEKSALATKDPDILMGPPKAVVRENTRLTFEAPKVLTAKDRAMLESAQNKSYNYMYTPSPAPGVSDTPFMTWGEIEGTPLLLGAPGGLGDSGPGPKFKMDKPPDRDEVGHELSRQVGIRERKKKQARLSSVRQVLPSPSHGMAQLSPAARRLLAQQTPKSAGLSADSALRASYNKTPSAQSRPTSSRFNRTPGESRRPSSIRASATPVNQHVSAGRSASRPAESSKPRKPVADSSITDNLLDL